MKKEHVMISMVTAMLAGTISVSCVEDEGNYTFSPINEIIISGIEEEYSKIAYAETLSIIPDIEGSLSGKDESQLEYKWFFSSNSGMDVIHTLIGTDRNLEFPVNIAPGNYRIYFQVKDNTTGIKSEASTLLKVSSRFVRGFYLFGDKEDGTCGMDFVSMIDGRDTTVVKDVFTNTMKLKGAKDLIFSGGYYDENPTDLWAIFENESYEMEHSASLETFDLLEDLTGERMIFPTIPVTHPLKVIDFYPHAYGKENINLSRSARILMTENELFTCSMYNLEAYGNPINRYSMSTNELFKPSPYVFYPGNSSYVSNVMVFDETNLCFVGLRSYSYATNCSKYNEDTEAPFYFDQTKYTPVRTLVYGENGAGNAGRSYALMTDAQGKFYIYGFSVAAAVPAKYYGNEIDLSVATDFDKASHYAFFSSQAIILYSAGSKLWAYDYNRNEAKMMDFGAEITYLAMDYHSNDQTTDFIVATYSPAEKGTVRKFTIADDQNKIEITPHEKEVWKTDLKVVKAEYRNATN